MSPFSSAPLTNITLLLFPAHQNQPPSFAPSQVPASSVAHLRYLPVCPSPSFALPTSVSQCHVNTCLFISLFIFMDRCLEPQPSAAMSSLPSLHTQNHVRKINNCSIICYIESFRGTHRINLDKSESYVRKIHVCCHYIVYILLCCPYKS